MAESIVLLQALLRRGRRQAATRLLQACGARIVAYRGLEMFAASILQGAARMRPAQEVHGSEKLGIITLQSVSRAVLARAMYKAAR